MASATENVCVPEATATSSSAFDAQRFIVWILFLFSGACGLIYEVLWCRQLGLIFGNTVQSMSAVLAAFMGGLALGSFAAGWLCHRIKRPLLAYGVFEVAIGLYCAVLPWVFSDHGPLVPLYRSLYGETGSGSLVVARFAISFVLLLVPTILMGATLPVLAQFLVRSHKFLGRTVGQLYAVNTFGAVIGAAATGFLLLPELGKLHTNWLAVACNLTLGLLAITLGRRACEPYPAKKSTPSDSTTSKTLRPGPGALKATVLIFGVTGFAAMATQIGWTRALTLATGSSTYAFSLIVAVFILGLALGGMWGARIAPKVIDAVAMLSQVLLGIGLLCLFLVLLLGYGPLLFLILLAWGSTSSWSFLLALQAVAIAALILGPTFLMGATLPLTMQVASRHSVNVGRTVGTLYAVNTVGAILGSALGGLVLLPLFQIQSTLELMALCYAVPGLVLFALSASRRDKSGLARSLALTAALLVLYAVLPRWDPRIMSSGAYLLRDDDAVRAAREWRIGDALRARPDGEIVYYREGASASVAVVQSASNTRLVIGGKPDASSASDLNTQTASTLLPELLHPGTPRDILVIGLGSGISAGAALALDSVERIDLVEMSPEVVEASWHFKPFNGLQYSETGRNWIDTPNVELILNDGRNHLLLTNRQYDVIASEPSNPWLAGIGNLFTREAFQLARARLKPDGVMCQWVQSYNLEEHDFLSIVRTFGEVFPCVQLWWTQVGDYLLIGSDQPLTVRLAELRGRLKQPRVNEWLRRVKLDTESELLAGLVVQGEKLRKAACPLPLHTDDNMLLEFSAPRALYSNDRSFRSCWHDAVLDELLSFDGLSANDRAASLRQLDLALAAKEHIRLGYEGLGTLGAHHERAYALSPRQHFAAQFVAEQTVRKAQRLLAGAAEAPKPDPARAAELLASFGEADSSGLIQAARDDVQFARAAQAYEEKRGDAALALLEKTDPTRLPGRAHLLRARILLLKQQYADAEKAAKEAAANGAAIVECVTTIARAEFQAGRVDEALATADKLLRSPKAAHDPTTADLWLLRTEALMQRNRFEDAVATAEVARLLTPQAPEPYLLKAQALRAQGRVDDALWHLRVRANVALSNLELLREYARARLENLAERQRFSPSAMPGFLGVTRRLCHELCAVEPTEAANWELLARAFLALAQYCPSDAEFYRAQAAGAFRKLRELAGNDNRKLPEDLAKVFGAQQSP